LIKYFASLDDYLHEGQDRE